MNSPMDSQKERVMMKTIDCKRDLNLVTSLFILLVDLKVVINIMIDLGIWGLVVDLSKGSRIKVLFIGFGLFVEFGSIQI